MDPRKALEGEYGEAYQLAAEVLFAIAKAYDADGFVRIRSAHVSGISYLNIGDAGVELFERFSEAKVSVLTTVNPMSFDPDELYTLVDERVVEGQMRILRALKRMGAQLTLTCTPYYFSNRPPRGAHVARAESSAVVYANSILGAYTNRESGISALASALLGVTPKYGLHLEENRKPQIGFKLEYVPKERFERSALGILIGKHKKTVVALSHLPQDEDSFKLLGASAAASGRVALITGPQGDVEERVSVGKEDIEEIVEELSSGEDPEFYYVGCPHASEKEMESFAKKCRENRIISVAPELYSKRSDLVEKIRSRGCKVIKGTCIVVSLMRQKAFVTDSGKAARYCPKASLGKVLRKTQRTYTPLP